MPKSAWTEKDQINNSERKKVYEELESRSSRIRRILKDGGGEGYEHVVQKLQVHKMAKFQDGKRELAWLIDLKCSKITCQIQVQGTSSIQSQ
ncbi:hypothetical protein Tco_0851431 [Tanacetum coccineum]